MEIVTFDIYLREGPGGYVARAQSSVPGRAQPGERAMGLAQLLGSLSLTDIYRRDKTPASGDGAATFVQALVQLRSGFYDESAVHTVGTGLYAALPEEVRSLYNSLWGDIAQNRNKRLRVRLSFDSDELAMLPWEYLKSGDAFWLQHPRRSIVRVPNTGDAIPLPPTLDTLRILIWAANPPGTAPLEFEKEIGHIAEALQNELGDDVEVEVHLNGTALELLNQLQDGGFHVLHYIGHGVFDRSINSGQGEGVLAFEAAPGTPATRVRAIQLQQGIWDNPTLRLVFLNSCQTATGSVQNAYAALAFNLSRFTPAVIAMQTRLADKSAILLAKEFYDYYGRMPIDWCLNRARQRLVAAFPERPMDWGIPALFSRVDLDQMTEKPGRTLPDDVADPSARNNSIPQHNGRGRENIQHLLLEARTVLLACDEFSTDNKLAILFSSYPLSMYRDRVPQGNTTAGRVDALLAEFGTRGWSNEPVLALILEKLRDRRPVGDSERTTLDGLAARVRAAMSGT